jgi:multidrug efflux pump subunit AcrB
MRTLEIPIHQMSVTGLIIALGLLIDNAIVMVDEVRERLGHADPATAVAQSVRHLAVPLLGSTLTTVLAFMPIVLLPGPAGEFVGTIAVSVILALVSSLFLALTVMPSLAAFFGLGQQAGPEGKARFWQQGVSHPSATRAYRSALDVVLGRPLLGIALPIVIPLAGFWAGSQLDEQFFPPADRDQFQIELRLPVQTPMSKTREAVLLARSVLHEHPEVTAVHWFLGKSGPKFYYNQMAGKDGSPFYAQALVQLHSPEGAAALQRAVQVELDRAIPAAQVIVKAFEQGPPFDAPVELHILGPDLRRLRELGDQARAILASVTNVTHTRSTIVEGQPKLFFDVDEEAAQRAGLTSVEVASQLQEGLLGAVGGSLLEGEEELPIRVRIKGGHQTLGAVESLGFKAPSSPQTGFRSSIPLTALGDLKLRPQLASITRRDGERSNTIQGFLVAGVLPATALADFRAGLDAANFTLPQGYRYEFGGESSKRNEAVGNLMASVGLLLVLIAGTLILSFNSFRQAAIIGVVGFLSAGLSLAALYVFGYPFGFTAIVGTMGLIGVAINDAIVVLAAIREDPKASQGDPAAIREVVVRSTRHVVATTLTTIAGFVPLLLAGGDFWGPLATAIAGGVAGATLLALCFVPASFLLLHGLGMRCPLRGSESSEDATPARTPQPALVVAG